MKFFFYILVILCVAWCVQGLQSKQKMSITVDPIKYADGKNFLQVGFAKKIVCTGSTKYQKVDWYDPSGKIVRRQPGGRVHVQDQVMLSNKVSSRGMVLSIAHSTVADSGVWECRSGDLVANVSLCVLDPVEFIDPKQEVDVDNGRSITLSCKAKGDPEPTMLWERNGEIISDDGTTSKYKVMTTYFNEGIEGLMTITSLDHTDSGVYTCFAYQENGLVEDCNHSEALNITLNVIHAPLFFSDEEAKVYSLENESVELFCSAIANPKPTYRWFHERSDTLTEYPEKFIQTLENGTQSVLTIKANSSTFGERFSCKASNDYGSAFAKFKLLRLEEPVKPTEIVITNVTHDSLTVTWNEEENSFPVDSIEVQYFKKRSSFPPREYQWKRGRTTLITQYDEDKKITIRGLDEDTEYWIRFRLVNSAGDSEWTKVLASTGIFEEPDENIVETVVEEDMIKPEISQKLVSSSGIEPALIGVFCLALVVFVGVGCMLVVRKL